MPQEGDGGMPDLTNMPWYLHDFILGFEGDDGDEGGEGDDDADGDDSDDDDDDDDASGEDGDKGKGKGEDTSGLKNALKAERTRAKKAERELKKLQNAAKATSDAEELDLEEAKTKAANAESKSEKLATRLRKTELDNVITRHATGLKFRDIDDALSLLKREDDWVDQDEDDPSDIDVDEDAVKAALAKLAKAKPHLLIGDGDEESSGGKFGGRKDKSKDKLSDEALSGKYGVLGRRAQATSK